MAQNIRYVLIFIVPLGLMLAGCANPQRGESSSSRPAPPSSARDVMAVDQGGPESVETNAYRRDVSTAADSRYDITLEQIRAHVQNNTAVVIDARSPDDFARGHVRGAINVPAGQMEVFVAQIQQDISAGELIIIYCESRWCGSGDMVYESLVAQGYTNLRVYKPGWQLLALAKNLH